MALPILYSLRNCPYAMRARLALYASGQQVLLRDIVLSNKPAEMLIVSPKGTVPVLVTADKQVIDESLSIMKWAFSQTDPDDYLNKAHTSALVEMLSVIALFDNEFKGHLEKYRCSKRYHEPSLLEDRQQCERYLADLESRLSQHQYLMSDKPSLTDLALMPFIRQFARVERQWYLQSPYPNLRQWLNGYLQSKMFSKVMAQYPMWLDSKEDVVFGAE
ncbi:glutathione S-transferase [Parashewanella spongiae]|uniref:Glutathione S-transferase n=1 Tax=Parashewanella spongiae TaxID=342950 RepID=A0A3A6U1E7_9GAMM|nr:glutathione S-transferase [Parashewanella spongiae]MCL1078996.1 glutathione S-transferase [Parashewanella spongiae]RJY17820.1 glutathione S-transferase [Parashewanella spongiae]